ncbi:Hypp4260 [Branchiostoma lanceolatum]|uniref:Hypp4260 protein n=1 Tax=Branchiostoma lanceolatum TaxID=7740 RepID=A0A8K0EXP8_BRALA|nr:Hypp4260 [Branchiostoma lanceolatum]
MDPYLDQKFDELYSQCEQFRQHKQNLQQLKLKVKKLKKAGKHKEKRFSRSLTNKQTNKLTSHDQDRSGVSDVNPAVSDDCEPRVDDREMRDDAKTTSQEEDICVEHDAVVSEEDDEEVISLLEDGIMDDTSTRRVNMSTHEHRLEHQTLPPKTSRTLKIRLREPLEHLPQSANGLRDQDKVLPLFCCPAEHFGGVWQSIVVEKDEGPYDGMVE